MSGCTRAYCRWNLLVEKTQPIVAITQVRMILSSAGSKYCAPDGYLHMLKGLLITEETEKFIVLRSRKNSAMCLFGAAVSHLPQSVSWRRSRPE